MSDNKKRPEHMVEGVVLPKKGTGGREVGVRSSKDGNYAFIPVRLLGKKPGAPDVITVAVGEDYLAFVKTLKPDTLLRAQATIKVADYNGEKRYTAWATQLWAWAPVDRQAPAEPDAEPEELVISGGDFFD